MDEVTLIKVMLESGGNVYQATASDELGQLFRVSSECKGNLKAKVEKKLRKDYGATGYNVEWLDLDDSKGG